MLSDVRVWVSVIAAAAIASGIAGACTSETGGGVGAPCEVVDDCEDGLICDEHQGQGSCQEDHGHGDDDDSSGGTDDHGHESGETGHDTEEHDTEEHDTEDHDSGSETGAETDAGTSTGEGSSSGGQGSAECEAFCGCMQANCASFDAYPYADEAACMTACEGLNETERSCFAGFCEDAANEPSPALAEHWCEHAWGELGTDEC